MLPSMSPAQGPARVVLARIRVLALATALVVLVLTMRASPALALPAGWSGHFFGGGSVRAGLAGSATNGSASSTGRDHALFYTGDDNQLWQFDIYQKHIRWGGDLPGAPAAVSSDEVFYRGRDAHLYHVVANGVHENWGGTLPEDPVAAPGYEGSSATAFYRGANGYVYAAERICDQSDTFGGCTRSHIHHERVSTVKPTGPLTAIGGRGNVDVFYAGDAHRLQHVYVDAGGWHTEDLGGYVPGRPAAASEWDNVRSPDPLKGNKHIDVYYRGGDRHLYRVHLGSSGWGPHQNLGGELPSDPVAAEGAGRTHVFYRGSDNRLYHLTCMAPSLYFNRCSSHEDLGGVLSGDPAVGGEVCFEVVEPCVGRLARLTVAYPGTNRRVWWLQYRG